MRIFEENQTGLHHKTHRWVVVKQEMIAGQFQGTSFAVIALNRESNFTRREKNNFHFHKDKLTWPETKERPWM